MGRKLMPINVYRRVVRGQTVDCTNGGISAKVDSIYVVNPDGFYNEDEVDPALVFEEQHRGGEYWALVPVERPRGMCGPMDGGNLAESSDSRIKHTYHIHDRFEAPQVVDSW